MYQINNSNDVIARGIDDDDDSRIDNNYDEHIRNFIYVDSHCHIEDKGFNKNRDEIIKNAKSANVRIITSGASFGGCKRALMYKKLYDSTYNIYLTLGFHPGNVRADNKIIDRVYNLIIKNEKKIIGVGEVGLDSNVQNIDRQKEIFSRFIKLSEELNKPIIIHGRGLERECYNMLKNRVISMFHCYSGDVELAKELISNGHYISLSTLVCFSNYHKKLIENLDLENIVVETDSPYLSPVKGKKNQPLNVIKVIKKIYEIKEKDSTYNYNEIVNIIYNNTKKLFKINFE